ncbi:MAG TPA: alpha/beta hydrolase [Candidatus Dormibacteraeota bacterium]
MRRPIRPAFASFQEGAPGSGIGRYRDERPAGPEKGTVLLLHGWAGTADLNWSHAYPQLLAAGYRVLAPDLPGHGRGARDVRFTLEVAADAAAKLITDAGAGKVVVAGHSMGGSIALLLASRHLEAVSGLVVMATQLSWPGIPPGWLLRPAGRLAALGARAILRWGGRTILGSDPERNLWIRRELQVASIPHLADALAALRDFDARSLVRAIDIPAVVLVTSLDTLVPPDRQRQLAAAIPNAEVIEVAIDHSDPPSRPGHFPQRLVEAVERCFEKAPD